MRTHERGGGGGGLKMTRRAKEFWIYQKRLCPDMWALDVCVETDHKRKPIREWDVCMFAEFIPRSSKSDSSIWHRQYSSPEEFADDIAALCHKYGQEFTDSDKDQLIGEFVNILMCS